MDTIATAGPETIEDGNSSAEVRERVPAVSLVDAYYDEVARTRKITINPTTTQQYADRLKARVARNADNH